MYLCLVLCVSVCLFDWHMYAVYRLSIFLLLVCFYLPTYRLLVLCLRDNCLQSAICNAIFRSDVCILFVCYRQFVYLLYDSCSIIWCLFAVFLPALFAVSLYLNACCMPVHCVPVINSLESAICWCLSVCYYLLSVILSLCIVVFRCGLLRSSQLVWFPT